MSSLFRRGLVLATMRSITAEWPGGIDVRDIAWRLPHLTGNQVLIVLNDLADEGTLELDRHTDRYRLKGRTN